MLVDSMQKLHLHTWLYSPTDGQVSNPNLTWVISRLCTLYQDSHVPRLGDEVVLGYIAVQQQHMTTCHDFCNNCHSRWLADVRSHQLQMRSFQGMQPSPLVLSKMLFCPLVMLQVCDQPGLCQHLHAVKSLSD